MIAMTDFLLGFAGAACFVLLILALALLTAGCVEAWQRERRGESALFGFGVVAGLSLTVGLIVAVG